MSRDLGSPQRVVIDTSALIALLDADDEFHKQASDTFEQLLEWGSELWLSSYIRVETIALAHRRMGFQPVAELVESLDLITTTVWVDEELNSAAWDEFSNRKGQRLSFVDCSTLLVAGALGATIFAFDSDFSLEGLPVVP
jgi:predicted nucleic acid-binding protein